MPEKPIISDAFIIQTRPAPITVPENAVAVVNDAGTLKAQAPDGSLTPLSGGGGDGSSVFASNVTALSVFGAASLAEGSLAYVASVRDTWVLQQSAVSTDAITVVNASGKAGYQWLRMNLPPRANGAVTTWYIDPVNGNDEAAGTSSAAALKTLGELSRRWWGIILTVNVTVNVLGNVPSGDAPGWNFNNTASTTTTFVGSLGPVTGFGGAAIDNTACTTDASPVQIGSNSYSVANMPAAVDTLLTPSVIKNTLP